MTGSRSLKLPAVPRVRVPVTTRHRDEGQAGKGGTPVGVSWVTAGGVPTERRTEEQQRGEA
jgi:hypothetical protein